jgi:hypothetical protein
MLDPMVQHRRSDRRRRQDTVLADHIEPYAVARWAASILKVTESGGKGIDNDRTEVRTRLINDDFTGLFMHENDLAL